MKILELFSGTESFSKVAKELGHEVFTVEILKKFNPDLCKDVLDLEVSDIPFKPDMVWASPPCTEYSKAKSQGKRDIKGANKIVMKTLKLIKELNPKYWVIENPQTGLLKEQDFMKELRYIDVSYCKYGLPYKKQTRIWTNIGFTGKVCNKDCNFMIDGKRHIGSAGCGGKGQGHKISYSDRSYTKLEKYGIPRKLCLDILKMLEIQLNSSYNT